MTRRAENVVNQSSRGLGRAAGALAGQNLGAGYADRARSSVKWSIVYVSGASLSLAAVFLLFPEAVASFFNSDTEFVRQAGRWLSIVAVGYFSMNAVQVLTQAFNTSGATLAPMIITLSTVWLVEIPLAFSLANLTALGEVGVPWAIVIGMSVRLVGVPLVLRQRALAQDRCDLRPLSAGPRTSGYGPSPALCYSCIAVCERNATSKDFGKSFGKALW